VSQPPYTHRSSVSAAYHSETVPAYEAGASRPVPEDSSEIEQSRLLAKRPTPLPTADEEAPDAEIGAEQHSSVPTISPMSDFEDHDGFGFPVDDGRGGLPKYERLG